MVKIGRCTCEHEYQDQKYGKYNRVMNSCEDSSGGKYRCTVCGKESDGKPAKEQPISD